MRAASARAPHWKKFLGEVGRELCESLTSAPALCIGARPLKRAGGRCAQLPATRPDPAVGFSHRGKNVGRFNAGGLNFGRPTSFVIACSHFSEKLFDVSGPAEVNSRVAPSFGAVPRYPFPSEPVVVVYRSHRGSVFRFVYNAQIRYRLPAFVVS